MCKKIKLSQILAVATALFFMMACDNSPKQTEKKETQKLAVRQVQSIEKYGGDCEDKNSPCFAVELSYPELASNENEVAQILSDTIQKLFLASPFEDKVYGSQEELNQDIQKMYADYKEDFPEMNVDWFLDRKIKVEGQFQNVITISFYESSFMGGAHPNSMLFYKNYDLNTGKLLSLNDLLDSKQLQLVKEYAEKEFKKVRGLSANASFADEGYWFPNNHFALNDNFYQDEEGITFYFNSYEIAPYSFGETIVRVPSSIYLPN